ncbi:hypothetical protein J6590_069634 [Homalodisca vitripennis]|nr:hypothetical protein J6590_069634 [Homalodisca vitripennis]
MPYCIMLVSHYHPLLPHVGVRKSPPPFSSIYSSDLFLGAFLIPYCITLEPPRPLLQHVGVLRSPSSTWSYRSDLFLGAFLIPYCITLVFGNHSPLISIYSSDLVLRAFLIPYCIMLVSLPHPLLHHVGLRRSPPLLHGVGSGAVPSLRLSHYLEAHLSRPQRSAFSKPEEVDG